MYVLVLAILVKLVGAGTEDIWVTEGPCIDFLHANLTQHLSRPRIVEHGQGWVLVEVPNQSCLVARTPTCTIAVTVTDRSNNSIISVDSVGCIGSVAPLYALRNILSTALIVFGTVLLVWTIHIYRKLQEK